MAKKSNTPQKLGGVGILIIVVVGILVLISLPTIDVSYYTQLSPEKQWSHDTFDISIFKIQDNGHPLSNVCFRLDNTAENMLSPSIVANNFRATLETTAECKDCNIYTDLGILESQVEKDLCKQVGVLPNTENISLKVTSSWNTFRLPFSDSAEFSCVVKNELDNKIDFSCMRN